MALNIPVGVYDFMGKWWFFGEWWHDGWMDKNWYFLFGNLEVSNCLYRNWCDVMDWWKVMEDWYDRNWYFLYGNIFAYMEKWVVTHFRKNNVKL